MCTYIVIPGTCTLYNHVSPTTVYSTVYAHTHSPPLFPLSRGLIMGIWNSHTSVGNILGTIIPSFWADCDNVDDQWGWSFIVPSFIMVIVALATFLFLVNGKLHGYTVDHTSTCIKRFIFTGRQYVLMEGSLVTGTGSSYL